MSLYYANGPDGSRASKSRWGALRRAMRSRMGSASNAEAQAMTRMARITRMTQEGHELKAELIALQRSLLDDRMVREARIVADQGSPTVYSLDHERDFKLEQSRKEKLSRLHKLCRTSQSIEQMARRSIETLAPGECFPECDAYVGVLEPGADVLNYIACSKESTMRGRTLRRPHGPITWRAIDHGGTVLVGHVAETAVKATERLHCFAEVDWRERKEAVRQRQHLRTVQDTARAGAPVSRAEAAVKVDVEVKDENSNNDKLGSIAAVLAAAQQDDAQDDTGCSETDSDDASAHVEQLTFDSSHGDSHEGERDENFAYKSDGDLGIPPLGLSHWKIIGSRPFRRPYLAIPIRRPGGDAVLGVLCFDAFMTGARRAAAINNCRTLFYTDFHVALRDTVLYRQPVRHKKQRRLQQDTASSKNKRGDGSDEDSDEISRSSALVDGSCVHSSYTEAQRQSKLDLAVELQRGYVAAVNELDRSETGKSLCESHLYTLGWEGEERRDAAARAAHPERQYTKRELDKGSRWFDFERNVLMKNALGIKDRDHDVVPEPHDVSFAEQVADTLGGKWWDLRVQKALRCVDRSSWLEAYWNASNPCWQDVFAAVFSSIAQGIMFSASAAVWCIKLDAQGRITATQLAQVLDMRRLREHWHLWDSRHVGNTCSPAEEKSLRTRLMQCVEWSQMKVKMSGPALKLLLQQMNAHAGPQKEHEPFEMRATPERMVIEISFDSFRHGIAGDSHSDEMPPVEVRYLLTAARSTIFRGEPKGPNPRMRPSTPLPHDVEVQSLHRGSTLIDTIRRVDTASHFCGEVLDSKEIENCCSYWKEDMVLFGVLGHRCERSLHDVGDRVARSKKRNTAIDQLRSLTTTFVDESTHHADAVKHGDTEGFCGAAAKSVEDLMHRGLHIISDALCGIYDQGEGKAKQTHKQCEQRAITYVAGPVNVYAGMLASAASQMRFLSAHSKSTDGAPVRKSSRTVMKRQVLRRTDGGCCFRSADTTIGGAACDDGDMLGDGANDVTIIRDADSARKQGIVFFDRRANFDQRRGSQAGVPLNAVSVEMPPPPVSISWPWVCVPLCATADADAADAVAAAMKRELQCRNNIGVLCVDGFDGLPLGGTNECHPERGITQFLRTAASVLACAVDKVRKAARLRLLAAVSIDTAMPDYSRENWQRHTSNSGIYPTVEGTIYPAILKALRENIVYGIDAEVWRLEADGSVVQLSENVSASSASHASNNAGTFSIESGAAIERVVAKAGSSMARSIFDSLESMPRRTVLQMYSRAKAKAIAQGDEPPLPPNDDRVVSAEWQRFEKRGIQYGDNADATSMLTMAERVLVPFHDQWHPYLVGPMSRPCEWNARAAVGVEHCSAATPAPPAFTHVLAVTRAANHNAREDVHFGAQVGIVAQHLVNTVRGREARQRAREAALERLELNFACVPDILPACEVYDCADDISACLDGAGTKATSHVLAYAIREISHQLPGADVYVGLLRPRGKSIRFVACSELSVMAPRKHKAVNCHNQHRWDATDATKRRSLTRELVEGQGISWKVITKGVDGWRDIVVHDDKDALHRGVHLFVRSSTESDVDKSAVEEASTPVRSVGRPAAWPFTCVPVLDGDAVLGVLNVDGMDRVPIGRADEHPPERGVMPFLRTAGQKIGKAIGECRRKPAIAAINASTICKAAKDTDIYAVTLQAVLDVLVFAQQIEVWRVETDLHGNVRPFVVAERTVDALACNLNHQVETIGADITKQILHWLADAETVKKCLSVQAATCSRLFGVLHDPTAEMQTTDDTQCHYLLHATVKEGRANSVDAQFVSDAAAAASAALQIVRGREARAAGRRQAVMKLAEAIPSAKSEVKADASVGSEYWFYGNGHDQTSQDAVGNYVRRVCNAVLRGVRSCLPEVHACIGLLAHDAAGDAVRYAYATKGSSMLDHCMRRGHGICWASIDSPGSVVMVRNSSADSRAAKLLLAEHTVRSDGDEDGVKDGTIRYPYIMIPIEARPWNDFLGSNFIDFADVDTVSSDFGVRAEVPSDFPVLGVLCVDGFEHVPIGRPDEEHPEQGVIPFLRAMAAALGVGLRDHRRHVGWTRVENAWHSFAAHKLSVPPQLCQLPLAAGCNGVREMWLTALDALRINIPFAHALEVWRLEAAQNDLVSVCQMHIIGANATEQPSRRRCVDITFCTAPPGQLTLVQKGAVIAGLLRGRREALAKKPAKTGAAGEPFTLLEAHNIVIAPFDADGVASAARMRAHAQNKISPAAAPSDGTCAAQSLHEKGNRAAVIISSSSESDPSDSGEESVLPEVTTGRTDDSDTYWALAIVRTVATERAPVGALPHNFDHYVLQRRREHHDDLRYTAGVVRRLENALRRLRSTARLAHIASANAARSALRATAVVQKSAAAALRRIDSMQQTKRRVSLFGKRLNASGSAGATSGSISEAAAEAQSALGSRRQGDHSDATSDEDDDIHSFRASEVDLKDVDAAIAAVRKGSNTGRGRSRRSSSRSGKLKR